MIGDITDGATARGTFNTDVGGVPTTLVSASLIVKKLSGATATAGATISVDAGGVTGCHEWAVDTTADALYADGGDYSVRLASGTTLGGEDVEGKEVGSFSIANRRTETINNKIGTPVTTLAADIAGISVAADARNMLSTTIATLTSQTVFTLTAGSADNDAYNNCLVIITDQSTSTQKAVARIADYVGSTRTVTLRTAPGFTIATGDTIAVVAEAQMPTPMRKRNIAASRILTAKSNSGTDFYGVVGTMRMVNANSSGSGPLSWAVELKGSDLGSGDTIDSMEKPTVGGADAANLTITDWDFDGTRLFFEATLSGSAAADDDIEITIPFSPEEGETEYIVIPVTVGVP